MGLNDGWISRPGQFASFYLSTSLSKDYTTIKKVPLFFFKEMKYGWKNIAFSLLTRSW